MNKPPRSNKIKDSDAPKHVRELKDFLGLEALAKAQACLDKDLLHHSGCYELWARHLKPWLFAFRMYDLITQNDTQTPSAWPTEIRGLVGDALMLTSLHHCMPEEVRSKYRKDLLLSQHNDFMVEIFAAWHYYLAGYDVQWYPLGHIKCPEFRVQGGGLDFDVECRRFCIDLSEDIKTPAVADTCDTICKVLERHNLWGQVRVEFADDFNFDPGCIPQWSNALAQGLDSGQTTLQLDPTVRLTLELKPSPSPSYTPKELVEMERDIHPTERIYLQSKRNGDTEFDPIVFRCSGPRKTPEELRDYIYKTLKEKVNTQLAPDRAGVVIVRFTGLRDSNVFNKSEGLNEAINKLFERPHLTAVILQCEGVAIKSETGSTLYSTPSTVYLNDRTTFPEVAAVIHL